MATVRATTAVGTIFLIAAAILVAAPPSTVTAQSPAPAPGPATLDCTNYLLNMSDCLSYVEAVSNLTAPETACCPELAGMVDSQPVCLCQLLSNANSFGIEINIRKALDLPSACAVSTPPVFSFCSAAGYPIGAPTPSPSKAPSSPGGSDGSGASSIAFSQLLYGVGLATATLSTFFWF